MSVIPSAVARRGWTQATIVAGGALTVAWVGLVDPGAHPVLWPCPMKAITGYSCPLCGATRATHALLHGHLGTAVDFNALYVVLLPLVMIVGARWLLTGRLPRVTSRPWFLWTAIGVAAVWMVVRNLPWSPFRWLAA